MFEQLNRFFTNSETNIQVASPPRFLTKDSIIRGRSIMLNFCSRSDGRRLQRLVHGIALIRIHLALLIPFESSFLIIYHAHELHCT